MKDKSFSISAVANFFQGKQCDNSNVNVLSKPITLQKMLSHYLPYKYGVFPEYPIDSGSWDGFLKYFLQKLTCEHKSFDLFLSASAEFNLYF